MEADLVELPLLNREEDVQNILFSLWPKGVNNHQQWRQEYVFFYIGVCRPGCQLACCANRYNQRPIISNQRMMMAPQGVNPQLQQARYQQIAQKQQGNQPMGPIVEGRPVGQEAPQKEKREQIYERKEDIV